MRTKLLTALALGSLATSANAVIVNYSYTNGYHSQGMYTAGSNGAAIATVYGDGANTGVSAQNICVNGNPVGTQRFCNDYNIAAYVPGTGSPAVTFVGGGAGNGVAGSNGLYWANASPVASYGGTLTYDTSQVYSYTDAITSVTSNWYLVTGGALTWTGQYGLEVAVNPSATSGGIGGSFFSYSFLNTSLALGASGGTRSGGAAAKCDLGFAGAAIVGTLLCGPANPISGFSYNSSGTYVKPVNWAMVQENGDGTITLMLWGNRRSSVGSGNDLQETLVLSAVPVPAAVWMFGSALGALGLVRRRFAA
jgi:hypothetical protein